MDNNKRLERIEELEKQIFPLSYERTFLKTQEFFEKESYHKDFSEETIKKIRGIKGEIETIDKKLMPLFAELRALQARYLVSYEGQISNPGREPYFHPVTEEFYLATDCQIDTGKDGWEKYTSDPACQPLFEELFRFITQFKFSQFYIRAIKRL